MDALPLLGDALPGLPAAFGLELIYNKQDHQVTIYATIPDTLAAIIATSEPPTAPAAADPAGLGHSPQHPRM